VMLGRAAYHTPAILGEVDRRIFGADADIDAFEAVELYRPYMARQLERGVHLAAMSRHMLGLFHAMPGARTWRRILTVEGVKPGAGLEVVDAALAAVALGAQDQRGLGGLVAGEAA
jgi:tRNA-dihydrouridine synthase A